MRRPRGLGIGFGVALILVLLPDRAQAYVDPGTGSYILQIVLAGLLGALFALKTFWHRMMGFFRSLLARRSRP